jgi:hypothetical protein
MPVCSGCREYDVLGSRCCLLSARVGTGHGAKGDAVYLLYNGILGDAKSNTLTGRVLRDLPRHDGPKVIFSECTSLGDDRLRRENIIFKHIPYDVKGR